MSSITVVNANIKTLHFLKNYYTNIVTCLAFEKRLKYEFVGCKQSVNKYAFSVEEEKFGNSDKFAGKFFVIFCLILFVVVDI